MSSKNHITVAVLWLIVLILIAIPFFPVANENSVEVVMIGLFVLYFIAAFLAWILLDTKYTIKQTTLNYRSGPIRGSIPIGSIRKVEYWNKWYVPTMLKPALDKDGIIIYYDKFEDIFISPKDKVAFIAALREINPNVEVV